MLLAALVLLFAAVTPADAIRRVLDDQQAAWNSGDIDTFMKGYHESPETLFVGKVVTKGYVNVLANYHKGYSTKDAMGALAFSEIEVKTLDERHAIVTGRFHLERKQEAGGEAKGIFSLVFEKEPTGWKIILDHTS